MLCLREVEECAEQVVAGRLGIGRVLQRGVDELVDEGHRRLAQQVQRRRHPGRVPVVARGAEGPVDVLSSLNSSNDRKWGSGWERGWSGDCALCALRWCSKIGVG